MFRDDALESVRFNAGLWFDRAMVCVKTLKGTKTGEEIRLEIEPLIGPPHHHNAYGSLISQAIKARYLTPTGVWRKMRTPKSHARRTPEYRCGF